MREITYDEYINVLFEILKYVDEICKENDIKYTLIGGSLIGAIRHSDIIPWDDDIDIALTHDNYVKLREVMINQDSRYRYMDNSVEKSYYFPSAKIVDNYTFAFEEGNRKINNYGAFVDVFEINNAPCNDKVRRKYYKKVITMKKIFGIFAMDDYKLKNEKNVIKKFRNFILHKIGCHFFIQKFMKVSRKYNNEKSDYMLSTWPTYGYEHEIFKSEYFNSYIEKQFRNINAMIVKNYDQLLKTTFGNYMELPPEEKRIPKHNIKAYWKENNNEEK